ncbi:MAG: hypothetical protein QM724_05735 [Flavobacteriales bacterium]
MAPPAKEDRGLRKEQEKELRKLKAQVERCELELAKLEAEQKELQDGLGAMDTERMEETYTRLGQLATAIDSSMRAWEESSSQLEALTRDLA